MKNIEIERKFLVLDDRYKTLAIRHHRIVQGYLCKDSVTTKVPFPDIRATVRVRIRDNEAFLTIKSPTEAKGIARFEWERPIEVADAQQLLQLAMPNHIEKIRWIVPAVEKGLVWEVDEFLGRKAGLVLAELELEDENQTFTKPDWVGEEVTGDPQYYNSNM